MGAGIALEVKKRFPQCYEQYREACERKQLTIGQVLVCRTGSLQPQYIIHFPTKKHWRHASQIRYIEKGLDSLIEAIQEYKIHSIALPPLGCGLGGLDWNQVKPIIENKLSGLDSVEVYVYEPLPPLLDAQSAVLLATIDAYNTVSPAMSRSELENLVWLYYWLFPAKSRRRKRPPTKKAVSMTIKALQNKQYLRMHKVGKERLVGLASDAVRADVQAFMEAHPSARQSFEKLRDTICGYESLAGLQALKDVFEIRSAPERSAYFDSAWKAFEKAHSSAND